MNKTLPYAPAGKTACKVIAITVTLIMRWLNLAEFGGVFDKPIYKQLIFPNPIIYVSVVYGCLMAIKYSNYYHCNV